MRLEGIHHITAITGDAPLNLDFYTRVLGLRLVKKTVNQDVPQIYHLFYASEHGDEGSSLTFFEYPGMERGRVGAGMIHRITWRVGSEEAIEFWAHRLEDKEIDYERAGLRLRFSDPEGLGLELAAVETGDGPLTAEHPEIPEELALQGFDSVRAYAQEPERSRSLFERTLGFEPLDGTAWEVRGEKRGGRFAFDSPPARTGIQGAGSVHHIAWASPMEEHEDWREAVDAAGARVTPIIDRFWFRSIYFREPSGVLFEIATIGPGYGVDEPVEHLGEKLVLPPAFEHMRHEIEPALTPLPDPRASWSTR